ncbi:MltF family protein [Dysgonomonas macrotermitis]|uniref:Membrane-bound lytic murein transglycosylase F n=1 Tax=Dysgonomonas macrotermitis TaxID=1346286 RepID=A0A1M5IGF9_9BACT|nr:transporter substrate-binding domain-containing protein [Dysgonomonas macrotermitis]SHG26863.1 membrane-bound lytic murein transglycosylase F [Dysgonomonas macrotermitis]
MNKLYFIAVLLLITTSCAEHKTRTYDFKQIKETGELNVITMSSSTSYFIYKDEAMGYDYDLVKQFCDYHGLKLNIKVAENSTRLLQMLENGEGDLIASAVTVQNELKDSIIYCGLEQISHQVLVQRTGKRDSMVTDVVQLIGKEVYVKHDTKYHRRLLNLDAELGKGILIKDVEKDTITVEDLIGMVARKEINYTVADEYIAKLNKTYYRNIDVSLPLSFEQRSSWAVRKDTPELADSLNAWFAQNSRKPIYKDITKKYFELSKMLDVEYKIPKDLPKGFITPFDPLFKKYEGVAGYDWLLLASIAYQESRFKTNLSSWAGAVGLMGLMPRTAASFGAAPEELTNPEVSIKVGAGLVARLNDIFKRVPGEEQRLKFVLAAYNGGNGHIADAQALARKYGDDPYKWDGSVEKYIELKSKPEYYTDSVCKNGYLRGSEVVNYVNQVTKNWNKFRDMYEKGK